ncbi:unnamed protein product [Penicillium viridicatum]
MPRARRAMVYANTTIFLRQFTGVSAVMHYMSTLMQAISFGDKDAVPMSLSAVIVADRRYPGRAIYGAIWSLVWANEMFPGFFIGLVLVGTRYTIDADKYPAAAQVEQGEKRREDEDAESRRREEARRDELADFLARGFKRAFDLDHRRSASPRERQASPRERSPRRPRQRESESRAPPANQQQAPGRGTSRVAAGPVDKNSGADPADMIPARRTWVNGFR